MGMLIILIVVIISQHICISNHHIAYLKHTILVNYASIKLGKIKIK